MTSKLQYVITLYLSLLYYNGFHKIVPAQFLQHVSVKTWWSLKAMAFEWVLSCGDFTDKCPIELYFQRRVHLRLPCRHKSVATQRASWEPFVAENNLCAFCTLIRAVRQRRWKSSEIIDSCECKCLFAEKQTLREKGCREQNVMWN